MKEDLERRKFGVLRIGKKNDKGEESLGYVHITDRVIIFISLS